MSADADRLKQLLRDHGYLATSQRIAMFQAFRQHYSLSIKQLAETLAPIQDRATVYRNIKIFEELGIITRLQLGWKSKLELSDIFHPHHHHITCLGCGKVTSFTDNSVLESEINQISHTCGFKPVDHQVEIRGYCSQCAKSY